MRWIDRIIDLMDMSLSKLWEIVEDRGAWWASVHMVTSGRTGVLSLCTVHVQDVHSGIFCRLRKTHSRVLFKTGALAIPRGSSGLGSSFHSLLVPFLVGELRSLKLRRPEKKRRGSVVGCRLWGRTESDTTKAT